MCKYTSNQLVCFSCNNSVSIERFNFDNSLEYELKNWTKLYNSIDYLWLDSSEYELWASKELSNPESNLHKRGFLLQSKVKKHIKCYYWWFQDVGVKEFLPLSNCPCCGALLSRDKDRLYCNKCLIVMQLEI